MTFNARKQTGFSLIEVLIAALVMGVGLFGIVLMQTKSVQYSREAYLFSQATFLANDIAERMRSNVDLAESYVIGLDEVPTSTASGCAANDDCDENALVQWDLSRWKEDVARLLPGGKARVMRVPVPGGAGDSMFYITVQFVTSFEVDGEGIQTTQAVDMSTQI